jgi:hypothetical protein
MLLALREALPSLLDSPIRVNGKKARAATQYRRQNVSR